MPSMTNLAAVMVLSLGSALAVASPSRIHVSSMAPLFSAAFDDPGGNANGVIVGRYAEAVSRHFKTTAPLLADVTTIARYRQPGCRRFNVRVSQESVVLPGKSPQPVYLDLGIDYCRDGSAPKHPLVREDAR